MTAVEMAIKEITDLLAVFAPQHEGLRDYDRLNLHDDTHIEVRKSIAAYDRREAYLNAAIAALTGLMADGHPDIPVRTIDISELQDLQANAATIEAALLRFASNAAVDMAISGGNVVPKA